MNKYKLTPLSKILILIALIALVVGGIFFLTKKGIISTEDSKKEVATKTETKTDDSSSNDTTATTTKKSNGSVSVDDVDEDGNVINTEKSSADTINLSLDEWIGWKEIIDANGGLTTASGSIYDKLGIKVNISIINDATQSSNALIAGSLDAAGYTINRTAFLSKKFEDANFDFVMPYVTNFSNGGDGIIAKSNINSVNDLKGAKIGVPQFSEAHTLILWFVNQSDLPQEDKEQIIENLIFFATPDEAAKAFFAGQIDVAATWEPYLTQAENMSDAHIFFSTKVSSSLVMDGIVFSEKFATENKETVTKFIDGALQAGSLYETDMETIKTVMPMFATASDQDILDNCAGAKLTTYADVISLFSDGGTAKTMYTDMCEAWQSIGEQADASLADKIFDISYISALDSTYGTSSEVTKTDAKVDTTTMSEEEIEDAQELLKKFTTVTFVINTAKFDDAADASAKLDEFIKVAKTLDGAIIEIAGNTDPNPTTDPDDKLNKQLSESRAETVKQYFILNGIDPKRIITVGNGSSNPMYDNDTEEHRALNRRTDVSFKIVE